MCVCCIDMLVQVCAPMRAETREGYRVPFSIMPHFISLRHKVSTEPGAKLLVGEPRGPPMSFHTLLGLQVYPAMPGLDLRSSLLSSKCSYH